MRSPDLLGLIFKGTDFPPFPLWTFRWLVQLQHELHRELSAHILELLFRSLCVRSSRPVCLSPASKHVALPNRSDNCERLLPL